MKTSGCPGQDDRNLKASIIPCPACGYKVEIFSDELRVRCPACRKFVYRERPPSCIDWCKAARECVGAKYYDEYLRRKKRDIITG